MTRKLEGTTAEDIVLDFQQNAELVILCLTVYCSNLLLMRRLQQETCCYYTGAQLEGIRAYLPSDCFCLGRFPSTMMSLDSKGFRNISPKPSLYES